MRVALTGTPGTGKTTVADAIDAPLSVVHLGEVIEAEGLADGYDPVRDTAVVDVERLAAALADRDDVLLESHLAHRLPADRVVVLRCHPEELERRLRDRGVPERSVVENAEAEALDVILVEAVDRHGPARVFEVDTTGRAIADVVDDVEAVIREDRPPSAGEVDFTGYL